MRLNDDQERACELLRSWWRAEPAKTPFRLDGYAGTGKTTVVQYLLRDLGVRPSQVRLLAPTGKAARVLGQKTGLPSSTIHRELYTPVESAEVTNLKRALRQTPHERRQEREQLMRRLAKAEQREGIGFAEKDVDTSEVQLYVVDEASMVADHLARDLRSLKVPLVLLGDPGQLPPVKGKPGFYDVDPVLTLTQIMRQDEGSTILEAAQAVRNGSKLSFGDRGAFKRIKPRALTDDEYAAFDVLLCGTHRVRRAFNRRLRRVAYGDDLAPLPVAGDKLVCRRNNYKRRLLNGQLLTCIADAEQPDGEPELVQLSVRDDEDVERHDEVSSSLRFREHYEPRVPVHQVEGAVDLDYAYALTVHSAQGSEWERVVVLNDWPGKDHERWLYTALTRGADEVVLVG